MINWNQVDDVGTPAAGHIPTAVEMLIHPDPEIRERQGAAGIENTAFIQGTLYGAAYYVIDLLVELLERDYTVNRLDALQTLYQVVLGSGYGKTILLQDEGNIEKDLEQACRDKLIRYKERLERIEVRDEDEIEEKAYLLERIQEFSTQDDDTSI